MSNYFKSNVESSDEDTDTDTDTDTKKNTNIDTKLNNITKILEKTILPTEIINYIVNDFIDPRYKCIPCNTKFERYFSNYCEKCRIKCCNNCLLEKRIKNNYKLCKECYPTITDIYSLFNYVCCECNDGSHCGDYWYFCKRCNQNVCYRCCYLEDYCKTCYELIKDTIDLCDYDDYSRCERCDGIYHLDDGFRWCTTCEETICRDCASWCDECRNDTCNTCIIKCCCCKFECCNQCNTRQSKCNCNRIICDKCCSMCVNGCLTFNFDKNTYRCITCNYKFKDN